MKLGSIKTDKFFTAVIASKALSDTADHGV